MKRWISLLLCLTLVLAALPMGAQAVVVLDEGIKPFSDAAEIKYAEQNEILVQLGILSGYMDGSFQPSRTLTRAEAAVILARLNGYAGSAVKGSFDDVPADHWAYSFVAYCVGNGLLQCIDGSSYRPMVSITVKDLCKALLKIIGYENVTDDNCEELIAARGLLLGSNLTTGALVTRDIACLVIYNALCCLEIARWEGGEPRYYTDELLNPVTVLEHRFGVVRYSAVAEANEQVDLAAAGGHLEAGQTRLRGHNIFAVSTPLSLVGHRVDLYVKDGKVLGKPHLSTSESSAVFSSLIEYRAFMSSSETFSIAKDAKLYLAYDEADESVLWTSTEQLQITVVDYECDGCFDLILVNPYRKATVTSAQPLELRFTDGSKAQLDSYSGSVRPAAGDTVYALRLANGWDLKK